MKNIGKILFLGNSITKHAPKSDIGWDGNWGMAASAEENDYVHRVMSRVHAVDPAVGFLIKNIADYEREFWNYDLSLLKEFRDYQADLVIMRIAENVDEEQAKIHRFGKYYAQLIRYINPGGGIVLCTGGFWDKPAVSQDIRQTAEDDGCLFVDLHHLSKEDANMAKDLFWHEGVGAHPSDRGMENIASLIWEKIRPLFREQ